MKKHYKICIYCKTPAQVSKLWSYSEDLHYHIVKYMMFIIPK